MWLRVVPIMLALAVLCGAIQGQDSKKSPHPTDATKSGSIPVFRSSTSVVTVNIVATDRNHHAVGGLHARDFTVWEEGKPQNIRFFESHSPEEHDPELASPALPPHQFTNLRNRKPGGVINIVLFDMLNTPVMDQAYARYQLLEFLQRLPRGQPIALFALGPRLHMVQGFTEDVQALLAAANELRPGTSLILGSSDALLRQDPSGSNVGSPNASGSLFERALAQENSLRTGYRVDMTVEAIGALSRAVSGYSGRKNLLWLSAGFPLYIGPDLNLRDPMRNIESYQAQVNRLGIAMASSEMAVYPIDVRGLMVHGYDVNTPVGPSMDPVGKAPDLNPEWSTHSLMTSIAELTGGQAFYNTNGIREAMLHSIERGSHYYTLAYVPQNRQWNGKYRSIKVRVSNRDVANLQYRRGYMALPADDEHPAVRIGYEVLANELTYVDVEGKDKTATVDFLAVAWDKKGAEAAVRAQTVEGQFRATNMAFGAHQEMMLRPGEYVLRVGA